MFTADQETTLRLPSMHTFWRKRMKLQLHSGNNFKQGVITILLLLLACAGTGWFACQLLLVPQPASFEARWGEAKWIQAAENISPAASFRYTTSLPSVPDAAFITLAADQVFRLYVNGTFIGTNAPDIVKGHAPRAYMYDILSELTTGTNVIAIRVTNPDNRVPAVRANVGIPMGRRSATPELTVDGRRPREHLTPIIAMSTQLRPGRPPASTLQPGCRPEQRRSPHFTPH
ncbi:MAG: hypothetical protein IMW89_01515 [Ktedonobacteraceae bacterium]|nr:hypothetical protein [Ktedonobacteraceae bacterium]